MQATLARAARQFAQRLQPHAPSILIAIAAIGLAWVFAATTLRYTRPFGLPLEDAYIYLTYAKQFGRAEPFSYYPGGGYSAGSTSVLWPMVIAPFWTLGARGHHLVWVSFALCTALYAATCVACHALVRELFGKLAGVFAAVMVLAIAPFAWTALAGMEVAFASALLVATLYLLVKTPADGRPRKLLIACLAATSLSRPEATMIVVVIVGVAVINRLRQRDVRAALWWASPLIAPLVWVTANKLLAGHWFPNTGVAKSHFYLPGFDWSYWTDAFKTQTGKMLNRLFWQDLHDTGLFGVPKNAIASPLVWPRLVGLLWLVGAVRVLWWAKANRRWLVGVLIVTSPFALVLAVIASSGSWDFHNYRYIAPAFPLFMITAACALAPFKLPERIHPWLWLRRGFIALAIVLVVLFLRAARPAMSADIELYAQNAADLNRQVVTLGQYIHRKLPDASIMFHDAGAIAYYGDTRVYDMLGLVTNHQAGVANNGPGSRFEFLESLPPEHRPTHFAYYPSWMGTSEFFGEVVLRTPLGRRFHARRLIGDVDMQLIVANWDHAHTAERPLAETPGWHLADRVDIADMVSERQHGWRGELGRRTYGDPTARWSFVHRQTQPGLLLDGGRTIRGRSERFTVRIDPTKPVRLVLRTGGERTYPWHETITKPVTIQILSASGAELATATLPAPRGPLVEIPFELRSDTREMTVRTQATGPYRAFHWFVLQPD